MKELTQELQKIIDRKVAEELKEKMGPADEYIKAIKEFYDSLDHIEETAKECLKESIENKLKFSEAEAEGFLRCIITVKNYFKDDMGNLNCL